MNDLEVCNIIKAQRANTTRADDAFEAFNRKLYNSYNQEKYGNEEEGRSQVVASDHFDTVESDMPTLARIFLGSGEVMHFEPLNKNDPEEAKEARQKTILADYYIRKQPESFRTVFSWIKETGMAKCSVVKYYFKEWTKVHYVTYKYLSDDELSLLLIDLEDEEGVQSVDIVERTETVDGNEASIKIKKKMKRLQIDNIPVENFGITIGSGNLQDETLAFDTCIKTKGELIAAGYDKKVVKNLPIRGKTRDQMERIRAKDQGGIKPENDSQWVSEEVEINYNYTLIDYDGDDIPERRLVVTCGDEVLENTPYNRVPYAILSQIMMPHSLIGKSRGEYAANIQKEKTAINRAINDNIYAHSRPRIGVDDSSGNMEGGRVNLDDLMNHEIGGVIRTDGPPSNSIMPIIEPYIGTDALQIIQYLEARRSSALGTIAGNQGLDADKFYKETATRFEGVQETGTAKMELVARCMAETGFRELYEGVIWTAQHFQDSDTEISVLGEPLIVDPREWKREHFASSHVGLGAGDTEDAISNLSTVLQTQITLSQDQRFAGLVDSQKIYNTLSDLSRALGKADPSKYYNSPEVPQEQLLAAVEQLSMQNAQLQEMAQNNPLAEAEQVKAQAQIQLEQMRAQVKVLQEQVKAAGKTAELQQKDRHHDDQMAVELTKIEAQNQVNVPGALI